MKVLTINADDFGLTEAVTRGIALSIQNGVVSRTSAMMCTEGFHWITEYGKEIKDKIGLHLQLTDGTPLLARELIPSLVQEDGNFPRNWKQLGVVDPIEVRKEWEAQMQKLLDLGITPTHIDTHHNVHRFPVIFKVYCDMAEKYKLPARPLSANMAKRLRRYQLPGCDYCLESWGNENVTVENFISHVLGAFRTLDNKGSIEMMCHPGFVDANLESRSHYLLAREKELEVLCDPKLPKMLEKHNLQLATIVPEKAKPLT